MNISLPVHLRQTRRDRERRRKLKRDRRHRQAEHAMQTARRRGVPPEELAEQRDPLGADPLVMRGFAVVDNELTGPDPADRVRWDGEPGPSHGMDPRTERPRDPGMEFDVDLGVAVEFDPRTEGFVEASLFERRTGTTDSKAGINLEATLPDFGSVEDDVLQGL